MLPSLEQRLREVHALSAASQLTAGFVFGVRHVVYGTVVPVVADASA